MKILLINAHSSQNAGDAALLEMALNVLSVFKGSETVVLMNEPETNIHRHGSGSVQVMLSFMGHFTSLTAHRQARWRIGRIVWGLMLSLVAVFWYRVAGQLPRWLPSSWRELFLAYAEADLAINCPGNIFVTVGRLGMPFLVSAYTVAYALMMGKPLYVLPQSIGPLKRAWERMLVRYLYSKARLVFIREPVSFRLAQEIGLKSSRLRLVPDLAFAYQSASLEEGTDLLKRLLGQRRRPIVGVTVLNRLIRQVSDKEWDRYESAMVYALSNFIEKYGGSVIFFPQVVGPTEKEDDRVAARRIVTRMGNPEWVMVVDERVSPGVLKAMYGLTDIFIATRMHSAIFALSMGVPTVLIEYLHKMHGLAEMLEIEEWTLKLSEVIETNLWETLDALWQKRFVVRCHLMNRIPDLVREVYLVGRIIAEDFCGDQHSMS